MCGYQPNAVFFIEIGNTVNTMPSCITHQLIAEKAKSGFPPKVKEAAEKHTDYFFLGAQGPDALFFIKPLSKKEWNLGRYLHRYDVILVFSFFREYLSRIIDQTELEQLTAYAAGFLCHYGGDITFHPYIYAYLKAHGSRGMMHQQIETDWDTYFARLEGKNAVGWNFPISAKKINREGVLYRLYRDLSFSLKRLPLKKRTFDRGIKRFLFYLRFFHRVSHAKFWQRAERLFRISPKLSCLYPRETVDCTSIESEEFFDLSQQKGRNADELFSLAVSESITLCNLFFKGNALERSVVHKSYLSVTEVK